ncbi:NAD(P)H-hydrate dehydratase [Candidatus Peregrinibacteria bacterium]|nr:NAD(P)H-hydrate dehydratase [Candidatus Peregrinibacteria bacterium]
MRSPDSHKGENGKVAVIGGSLHQHGAPLFSALAAEASGADLIFVCIPACHTEVTKAQSLNFQVHPFAGDELTKKEVPMILELLATMDCAVLGPGLARTQSTLDAIEAIIVSATCPLVLDASALQPKTPELAMNKGCVLTPHAGELERMKIDPKHIGQVARDRHITILAKGIIDRIADDEGVITEVQGGNAGLSVGGTGDALAGLTAGLIAQHLAPADACRIASNVIKNAGDALMETYGYAYGTRRVIEKIPVMLKKIRA